ncbi:MAG: enoyl-CoA hydratase [Alphaproteobacteria bacterium]|nr:enoyl-CoA hydratase [Alphaproteobacteria bacterium]
MKTQNPHCGIDRDSRGVAHLTICNAGPLNILSSAVIDGISDGFRRLSVERGIRIVVLKAESDQSFSIGGDIKEMVRLDRKTANAFILSLRDICEVVRNFRTPVIARIPGWCLGMGLAIAASCDFRIATTTARFGMPEPRIGIPAIIHAALLPRLIGWSHARWMLMTADSIDAATALNWGLVDAVAPAADLDAAIERTVASLLQCSPTALHTQKTLLNQWMEMPLAESINSSVRIFNDAFLTDEPKRLMKQFLEHKQSQPTAGKT